LRLNAHGLVSILLAVAPLFDSAPPGGTLITECLPVASRSERGPAFTGLERQVIFALFYGGEKLRDITARLLFMEVRNVEMWG
jgi:hypothetical protein